ncbi:hypothetical protein OSTOST_12387, partial [Ostertagia ostertagi]
YDAKKGISSKTQWRRPGNSPATKIWYRRVVPVEVVSELQPVSFSVTWMPKDACSCENILERNAIAGRWKELTSPDYPLPYCNNMHCTTMVTAPARHHVVLNITDFYTESHSDFLALYDGRDITEEPMAFADDIVIAFRYVLDISERWVI